MYGGKDLPLTSPVAHVEGINALVNEPKPVSAAHNFLELLRNLRFVAAGEDAYDHCHGPTEARPVMRTANGAQDRATHEVRVVGAE